MYFLQHTIYSFLLCQSMVYPSLTDGDACESCKKKRAVSCIGRHWKKKRCTLVENRCTPVGEQVYTGRRTGVHRKENRCTPVGEQVYTGRRTGV